MDSTQDSPRTGDTGDAAPSPFVEFATRNHRGLCTLCMALGAVAIAGGLALATWVWPWADRRIYYFAFGLALPLLAAGFAPFMYPPEPGTEPRVAPGGLLIRG